MVLNNRRLLAHSDITDLIGTDVDNDGNDDYDAVYVNTNSEVNVRGAELLLAMTLSSRKDAI